MEAAMTEHKYLLTHVGYGEAEEITGLDRTTLWKAVEAGNLKASGRGRGRRFQVRELLSFMDARGDGVGRGDSKEQE